MTPEEEEKAELERENARLRAENAALRAELEKVKKDLEAWKRGFRERSKRRTSAREGTHHGTGKPRGAKPGHRPARRTVPERIDRTEEYPVPAQCSCGGAVDPTGEVETTTVEEIPPVQPTIIRHVAHVGRCRRCQRKVTAPLPGATPSGRSLAQTQLGPTAKALALDLRFTHHVAMGRCGDLLRTWFGLSITKGGLSQLFDREARRTAPSLREIEAHVRTAPVVGADETGWHQDGVGGYVWLARTETASLFRIELSRGAWVIESMLGEAFTGSLCTDFYAAYTRHDDWRHAYCWAHVIREAKQIAELDPCPRTLAFMEALRTLHADGLVAQQTGNLRAQHGVRVRLGRLIADQRALTYPELARLQARLDEHFHGVLAFLRDPAIPADNNGSERDLRKLAVHRRITGGTRSRRGSEALAHWMSVTQTRAKNGLDLPSFVIAQDFARLHRRPAPSVFS